MWLKSCRILSKCCGQRGEESDGNDKKDVLWLIAIMLRGKENEFRNISKIMHGIQNSLDTALPATNAGKRFENDLKTRRKR